MNLLEVLVRPVNQLEERRFKRLMQEHHYLGALRKIADYLVRDRKAHYHFTVEKQPALSLSRHRAIF